MNTEKNIHSPRVFQAGGVREGNGIQDEVEVQRPVVVKTGPIHKTLRRFLVINKVGGDGKWNPEQ